MYMHTHKHMHTQTEKHIQLQKINFYLLDMLISQFYPHTPPLTTSTILITRSE